MGGNMDKEFNQLSEDEKVILEIEQEEDEESITIQRYAFNAFRIERSIRDILSWVEKKKIIIPEFQRDFVWNFNQSSRFIESILLGLPIPDFFMFRLIDSKENSEKFLLIDGLQRYTTIKQFVKGDYIQDEINKKFKINNKSSQWYKKTYDKLDSCDQDFFQDYSLKINVFDSLEAEEKTQKLYMTTIFERINTGSSKLSNQEVRNAIYAGEIINKIKESTKQAMFQSLLFSDKIKYNQRCKKEEFYLRLLSYYHIYTQLSNGSSFYVDSDLDSKINSSKDLMLCNFLFYANKNIINFENYNKLLLEAIKKIKGFQSTAFCTVKRDSDEISTHIHEVFSEALIIALMKGTEIRTSPEKFNKAKIKLWRAQEEYIEFFHTTTATDHVLKRVETIKHILAGEI